MTSPAPRTETIDRLNIALMLVSAAAAFWWPVPVFLFSYAVLGPLHYLTELSWLHEKGSFTRGRHDDLVLVALAAVGGLWGASVGLYAYDDTLGFLVLSGLSIVHVFLEFPLDHLACLGIGRELRGWVSSPRSGPSPAAQA